jgi:hypothetical protein
MRKKSANAIHFTRRGGVLLCHGAQGKTIEEIRISQGDQVIFVVLRFTDRTELAISLNSLPAVAVSLSAPGSADDEDLQPIAESGRILLPNLGSALWDRIAQPPQENKSRKR